MSIHQSAWRRALGLANGILSRHTQQQQPIPLSSEETILFAQIVKQTAMSILPDVVAMKDESANVTTPEPIPFLRQVLEKDYDMLVEKNTEYGGSWKRRGGVGAFMMAGRKWDRLEQLLQQPHINYDIFIALRNDDRTEGVIDDVRDLRRYLALIESYGCETGTVTL